MEPIPIRRYRQMFSPRVWERGEAFFNDNLVYLLEQKENLLHYEVTDEDDYSVLIHRDPQVGQGFRAYCSCPSQDACMHIAAVLMDGLDEYFLVEKEEIPRDAASVLKDFREESRVIDLEEDAPAASASEGKKIPEGTTDHSLFFLLQYENYQIYDAPFRTFISPYGQYLKKDGRPGRIRKTGSRNAQLDCPEEQRPFLQWLEELSPDQNLFLTLLPDFLEQKCPDLRVKRQGSVEKVQLQKLKKWTIKWEPVSLEGELLFQARVLMDSGESFTPGQFLWEHNHHLGILIPFSGEHVYYVNEPYSVLNFLDRILHEGNPFTQEELQGLEVQNPSSRISMERMSGKILYKKILPVLHLYIKARGPHMEMEPCLVYGGQEIPFQSPEQSVLEKGEEAPILYPRDLQVERALILHMLDVNPEDILSQEPLLLNLPLEDFIREKGEALLEKGGRIYYKESRNPLQLHPLEFSISSGIQWLDVDVSSGGQRIALTGDALTSGLLHFEGGFKLLSTGERDKINALLAFGRQKAGSIRLSRRNLTALALLEEDIDEKEHPELTPWIQALKRLEKGFSADSRILPRGLKARLRPYQNEGFQWLSFLYDYALGGILADDMGLGKTLQALSLFLYAKEKGCSAPFLVLAPVSTLRNWKREIEKFAPGLSCHLYQGASRNPWPENFSGVLLSSYHTMMRDKECFLAQSWELVVLDESQAVKNQSSMSHRLVKGLKARSLLALSGTPVENHIGELWAVMDLLNPGILGGYRNFMKRYRKPLADGKTWAMEELKQRIQPFLLRRCKEEVATDLPEREEIQVNVRLSSAEQRFYDLKRKECIEDIARLKAMGARAFQVSAALMQALNTLRQCAISPWLQGGPALSSKLEYALEMIREIREEGHKVLVFSQYTRVLSLLEPLLGKAELPYLRLDGSMTAAARDKAVRIFQEEEEKGVFLISIKAGGTGLNLVEADYVIILDPWWNPAVENQAIDRTHRIGQTRPVTAYRIISERTVEEKVLELQEQKKELVEGLLEGSSSPLGNMKTEELMNLF